MEELYKRGYLLVFLFQLLLAVSICRSESDCGLLK